MKSIGLTQSKFQSPSIRDDTLPRQHLVKRLSNWNQTRLTLVSAPAGYGKSTLVSLWLDTIDCPVVWLSLDSTDNDTYTFFAYLTYAIKHVFEDACQELISQLNGLHLPPLKYLTDSLLTELSAIDEKYFIVLEDFHHITDPNISSLISDILQYQPENLHLVIVTRHDPMLDLHKLRLNHQLMEIRIKDLRFNFNETVQCLQQDTGRSLSDDAIKQLVNLTEGWAAGLRLACYMLRDALDEQRFLDKFGGQNQFVVGYLIQEVLNQQTQTVRNFLMYTSILPRFCQPLCNALLSSLEFEIDGLPASSDLALSMLKDKNLFLIELEEQDGRTGIWYRYHHLFQDTLLHLLETEFPKDRIEALHHAAAVWLETQGYVDDAFIHYQKANDFDAQVALLKRLRYQLLNATAWQQLAQHLNRFSPVAINQYPDLLISKIWLTYHHGQYEKLSRLLQEMEVLLSETTLSSTVVTHFRGEMNALYALLAYVNNQPGNAIEYAQFALKNIPQPLWVVRTLARIVLAAGLQMQGDYGSALEVALTGFVDESQSSDYFIAIELQALCNIKWVEGDIQGLMQTARQAIDLSEVHTSRAINLFSHYHLGNALYQHNNLAGAEAHYRLVLQHPYLNYGDPYLYSIIGLALIHIAQKQSEVADKLMSESVDFLVQRGSMTDLQIVHAFQAELALRQNKLAVASKWADQFNEPPPFVSPFRNYFSHLTLAKIWYAQDTDDSRQRALALMNNIETYLRSIHNTRFLIEALALQALFHFKEEMPDLALSKLHEALRLTLPGGIIRAFVDLGAHMLPLVRMIDTDDIELQQFIITLIQAFETESDTISTRQQSQITELLLPEELTNREMDILLQLDQRKTNKEIAVALQVSENTVRYHLKNLFAKLNVENRRQAAAKARKLNLIPT